MTSDSLAASEDRNGAGVLPAKLKGGDLIVGGLLVFTLTVDAAEAGDAMASYRKTMHRFFKAIGRCRVTDPAILDSAVMAVRDFRNFTSIVLRGSLAGPLEVLDRTWPDLSFRHFPHELKSDNGAAMPAEGCVVSPITLISIEKELIAETIVLVLVKGYGDNRQLYHAYFAVRADVLPSLIEAQQSNEYEIRHFGVVLEAGIGEPGLDVMARMARDEGFRHDDAFLIAHVAE